jgi:hypothetical protein
MSVKLSNENSNLKTKTVISETSKTATSESELVLESAEFFKKISGFATDYITKELNIPSTTFTPAFTFPCKTIIANVMNAYAFIKALQKKFNQLAAVFDEDSNEALRAKYIKKSIALSSKGY